jgi:hypothetical protein
MVARMALAQVGPLTAITESLATAVGAGMLMGAFLMGAAGYLAGWTRQTLEDRALTDGLAGGIFAAVLMLIDLTLRYLVPKLFV